MMTIIIDHTRTFSDAHSRWWYIYFKRLHAICIIFIYFFPILMGSRGKKLCIELANRCFFIPKTNYNIDAFAYHLSRGVVFFFLERIKRYFMFVCREQKDCVGTTTVFGFWVTFERLMIRGRESWKKNYKIYSYR